MLVTGLGMAAVAAWVFSLLWSAGQSLGSFTSNAGADITNWLQSGPLGVSATDVSKLVSDLGLMSASSGATVVHGILGGATTLAEIAEGLLLTIVFSVYFLVRRDDYAQWLTSSLPPASRGRADLVAAAAYRALGGYTRAVAVNGAINAVLVWLVLAVLGIPLAVPLAALAFVGGFFPVVGTISAGAVAALVALLSKGLGAAVAMVVATAILHHLEIYIVGPMVIGRTAKFHPAGQVAALAIGLALGGVVGLFLAGPLLTVSITVARTLRADDREEGTDQARLPVSADGRESSTSSRLPGRQPSA
jgi:predicted PurR-regulated permease PerM